MLTNDSFETLTVSPAYPWHLLTIGSNSSEVARIQTYLNALRVDDPNIPTLTVDGKFGQNTKIAVQVFQYTHSLAADGIVGGATCNAIISAYNARFSGSADTFPGITLRPGARSQDVGHMQTYLNALSGLYTAINNQTVDSAYGQNMSAAARLLQQTAWWAKTPGQKLWMCTMPCNRAHPRASRPPMRARPCARALPVTMCALHKAT